MAQPHKTERMTPEQYDKWLDAEYALIEVTKFSEDEKDNRLCKELAKLGVESNPNVVDELLYDNRERTQGELVQEAFDKLRAGFVHEDKIIVSVARMLYAAVADGKATGRKVLEAASHFRLYKYANESLVTKVENVRLYGLEEIRVRLAVERANRSDANVVKLEYSPSKAFQHARQAHHAYRNYVGEAEQFLFDVTMRVEQFLVDCGA